jgi:putative methyltransferase (TIGR04325 family)
MQTSSYDQQTAKGDQCSRGFTPMIKIKRVIKSLLPPLIVDTIRRPKELRFSTWREACAQAGSYNAELVNRFRSERHALNTVDTAILQGNVLGLVVLALRKEPLAITDFGGATGDLGRAFLHAYPSSRYVVVENLTMVGLMREKTPVQYTTTMPEQCDLFFTSSTLQYLDDPMKVLEDGLRSANLAAVLTRNSFSETETFRVQRSHLFDNGMGPIPHGYQNIDISYPHRTIRESAVLDLARAMGFRCVSRLEETSGSLTDSYGKQLVFLRQ